MPERLAGRVAIVTGAGSGIGRAIAQAFAAEGARVVVNDINEQAAIETASGLANSTVVAGDVADLATHERLVTEAARHGGLHILVNNAAIQIREPFLDVTPETYDVTFAVNLRGPFFLAQRAAREMRAAGHGGCIVNVASVHDVWIHRPSSTYSLTKAAMRMVTQCLAAELAPDRIRVNSVSPGAVDTDMNRESFGDPVERARVQGLVPLGRIGLPMDIARAAVFLASEEADYITGATLYVDGGLLLH